MKKERLDPCWHKARIAARIIVKSRSRPLNARDKRLAARFAADPGVSNRLIEQGVAFVVAPWKWRGNEMVYRPMAA